MKTIELNYFDELVNSLLKFEGSTTHFLESLKKENLKVKLLVQEITPGVIERKTLLYFLSSNLPLIYSKSYLNISELRDEEYDLVKRGDIPLGKLFIQLNSLEEIKKENISYSSVFDEENCDNLNIKLGKVFVKKYDFQVSGRNVGQIIELFNSETLKRINQ